jgi:pimeloyl-ACP methyl ester carboxylesterase
MPLVLAADAAAGEAPESEAHARARKVRPEFARGELVRVAGGRNQAEAELIGGLLLEEGIPSLVRRAAGSDVPDFLAAGQRDVLVPESGAEAARELLGQVEAAAPAPGTAGSGASESSHALRLAAAIAVGALVAALVAWILVTATL